MMINSKMSALTDDRKQVGHYKDERKMKRLLRSYFRSCYVLLHVWGEWEAAKAHHVIMVIPQNIMTTWICKQLIFSKDIEMFMNIIILRNIYISRLFIRKWNLDKYDRKSFIKNFLNKIWNSFFLRYLLLYVFINR